LANGKRLFALGNAIAATRQEDGGDKEIGRVEAAREGSILVDRTGERAKTPPIDGGL
jgi:hypothetical protein